MNTPLASTLLVLVTLAAPPALAEDPAPDPISLMDQAARARFGDNSIQRLRLVSQGRGREKTRELLLLVRRDGDALRLRGELTAPAALAGTRFIVTAGPEGPAEVSVFLPALGTVTPIRGEQRSRGFLGTDFSLSDLSPPDGEPGAQRLVSEDAEGWLVETLPPAGTSEYQRIQALISKIDSLPHRVEYFRDGDAPVKRLELISTGEGGAPSSLRMTDLLRSSSTVMEVIDQRLDVPAAELPLSLFTPESLKVELLDPSMR